MSEKRRDKKGRLLWNGESQRKDGKYEYKYVDAKVSDTLLTVGNLSIQIKFLRVSDVI